MCDFITSDSCAYFIAEIAETCLFLASNKSSFITGAAVEVTGEIIQGNLCLSRNPYGVLGYNSAL